MENKFEIAIRLFDKANTEDPNTEIIDRKPYPKELLYAIRMTEKLNRFEPNASEAVQLAVRCQHICRWEIPRDSYGMHRKGYLTWRKNLAKFHAKKATKILKQVGYGDSLIDNVALLLQKKQLKRNDDTQLLEDVICLVFLEYYFEKFATKYAEEKLIAIVQKTWAKMSTKGHESALELNLNKNTSALITRALA